MTVWLSCDQPSGTLVSRACPWSSFIWGLATAVAVLVCMAGPLLWRCFSRDIRAGQVWVYWVRLSQKTARVDRSGTAGPQENIRVGWMVLVKLMVSDRNRYLPVPGQLSEGEWKDCHLPTLSSLGEISTKSLPFHLYPKISHWISLYDIDAFKAFVSALEIGDSETVHESFKNRVLVSHSPPPTLPNIVSVGFQSQTY